MKKKTTIEARQVTISVIMQMEVNQRATESRIAKRIRGYFMLLLYDSDFRRQFEEVPWIQQILKIQIEPSSFKTHK